MKYIIIGLVLYFTYKTYFPKSLNTGKKSPLERKQGASEYTDYEEVE
ncbi:MAG: hypothetical protein R2774_09005 [Saprospiraceae bacterium]